MHLFSWICETSWLTSPETQVSWTASPMQIGKPQRCLILTNGDFLGDQFLHGISRRCCGSMGKFWWNNMSLGCKLNITWIMKPEKCLNLLNVTGHWPLTIETQFRFVYCLSVPRLRPTVTICWKLWMRRWEVTDHWCRNWCVRDSALDIKELVEHVVFVAPFGYAFAVSVFHSARWDVLICPTHLPPKKV